MAVCLQIFTIGKAGVRFHRFFKFKVYRLSSLPAWQTVHCAALRGAELAIIYILRKKSQVKPILVQYSVEHIPL